MSSLAIATRLGPRVDIPDALDNSLPSRLFASLDDVDACPAVPIHDGSKSVSDAYESESGEDGDTDGGSVWESENSDSMEDCEGDSGVEEEMPVHRKRPRPARRPGRLRDSDVKVDKRKVKRPRRRRFAFDYMSRRQRPWRTMTRDRYRSRRAPKTNV